MLENSQNTIRGVLLPICASNHANVATKTVDIEIIEFKYLIQLCDITVIYYTT